MSQAKKQQTFNDGVVRIYEVKNTTIPGKTPKKSLVFKETIRYKAKTVGITRMNLAKQNNSKADKLIECPRREVVTATSVAMLQDGKQYQVINLQYPEEREPPTMLITMERLGKLYDISED